MGGGSFLWESGIYNCVIDMAYLDKSQAGAESLNITLLNDEGKKLKQTFWITNRKGDIHYIDQKGAKHYLPGYNTANNMCLTATSEDLDTITDKAENKMVNVYDFNAKKEKPTEKEVFVSVLGKKVKVAVLKQTVNKRVKQGNEYVDSAETRDENDIKEFYFDDSGLTVVERAKGLLEAILIHKWDERNKGKTISRVKEVKGGTTESAKPAGKKLFN
jgi:hypothetical protein